MTSTEPTVNDHATTARIRPVPGPTISAFTDDALGSDDARRLADRIRSREVSATEVVSASIERANTVGDRLRAVATPDHDRALATAASHNSRGVFAGVPTYIKDMTPVAGLPTGCGSASMDRAAIATETAAIAAQFAAMGTICLGKSALPEFGLTASTEFPDRPPTANPWNSGHSAGGSSGGAAALVASGVVPIAHAADGGGSIRIPAAACGLVGLKASRGRVVQTRSDRLMPVNLGASGLVSRTVGDTCAWFAAAEALHHDPSLPPIGLVERPADRRVRIGLLLDSPIGVPTDAATSDAIAALAVRLETMGHTVVPIESPVGPDFGDDFLLYWAALAAAIRHAGRHVIHPDFDPSGLTDFSLGLARHARRNIHRLPGAIRRLTSSEADFDTGLGRCDVILSPTVAHVSPPLGHLGMELPYEVLVERVVAWACFTGLSNATGTPAITLPARSDPATGLPVGAHLGARRGQERLLLELALEIEDAAPFPSLVGS